MSNEWFKKEQANDHIMKHIQSFHLWTQWTNEDKNGEQTVKKENDSQQIFQLSSKQLT